MVRTVGVFCTQCGSAARDEDKFCKNCGTRIDHDEPAPARSGTEPVAQPTVPADALAAITEDVASPIEELEGVQETQSATTWLGRRMAPAYDAADRVAKSDWGGLGDSAASLAALRTARAWRQAVGWLARAGGSAATRLGGA